MATALLEKQNSNKNASLLGRYVAGNSYLNNKLFEIMYYVFFLDQYRCKIPKIETIFRIAQIKIFTTLFNG